MKLGFKAQFSAEMQEKLMNEARKATLNSECSRAQTGVVITNPDGKILGRGWNTIPDEFKVCGTKANDDCPRITYNIPSGEDYDRSCLAIHSEVRAIADAGLKNIAKHVKDAGATLFLAGHSFLCNGCKAAVSMAKGIKDVYVQKDAGDEIKHYTRKEIMEELEEGHNKNLQLLAEKNS